MSVKVDRRKHNSKHRCYVRIVDLSNVEVILRMYFIVCNNYCDFKLSEINGFREWRT
jgi:hypothetical protein